MKISERKFAEQEIENYNRFVKWSLPYSWRVELLGAGFTKSLGAMCYSFVRSGYEEFDSLTRFISEGKWDVVEAAVKKIFDPEMKHWYADEINQPEENINQRYLRRYFPGSSAKNTAASGFAQYCQKIFQQTVVTRSYVEVFGRRYPLPIDRLFGQPNGNYQSCICHGDMNSNNVIVARNNEVIFIDFQHTGRGHVFEDFITMEACVRMYSNDQRRRTSQDEWEEVLVWETEIDNPSAWSSLPPPYQVIATIRSRARDNFSKGPLNKEPFRNYHYGVAAFNCRLLRIPDLTDTRKGKILAAILASLKNLEPNLDL